MQQELFSSFDEERIKTQISENQKQFDFDIREYPIEVLVQKFNPSKQTEPEIFIPDYQREFVWDLQRQSLFIESLLIGLPIPYIFVADIADDEQDYVDGRVEIVDGAQRMQTIYAYVNNQLRLQGMQRLQSLEGSIFDDLPLAQQRRFNRTTIRLIELKNIDEDGRRMMFERLNTGGSKLTDMEVRIGSGDSSFVHFLKTLAENKEVQQLICVAKNKENRREREEYILRFFAYRDRYQKFGTRNNGESSNSVAGFLNDYIEHIDTDFDDVKKVEMEKQFFDMLNFVKAHFRHDFRKSKNAKSISRIRFEAIAVGSSLALAENPDLVPDDTTWAYTDQDFLTMIRSDASNSKPKIINRIEFVKNKLLGKEISLDKQDDSNSK
ncbi:DUF262 domain-containing protein [Moraxella sp. FZLJ2107]|uniref:DUF262 domain-containing protein n=1 Tax=unclassified Moraxella TaxID=2685852 RepID=UPI0020C8A677|nr:MULTISPECIES: DUF262 domain-containing protein [unclassified Moraxella]UTO05344.1 DUF262 domain-containing protein [Moraxella sp. FZLJ2107]UTO22079.1 DUF262 domain-containing protein [Moraxella sp. FZLJ2109]